MGTSVGEGHILSDNSRNVNLSPITEQMLEKMKYLSKLQLELLKFSHHSEIQLDSVLLQLGAVLLNTHGLFRPDQIMIFLFLFISVFVSICGLKQCITFSQQSFQA